MTSEILFLEQTEVVSAKKDTGAGVKICFPVSLGENCLTSGSEKVFNLIDSLISIWGTRTVSCCNSEQETIIIFADSKRKSNDNFMS